MQNLSTVGEMMIFIHIIEKEAESREIRQSLSRHLNDVDRHHWERKLHERNLPGRQGTARKFGTAFKTNCSKPAGFIYLPFPDFPLSSGTLDVARER